MPHVTVHDPFSPKAPTRGIVLIPNSIFRNKKDIHEKLADRLPEGIDYTYFTELWRRYFWHVKVKKWNPFAKCDECVYLRFRYVNIAHP
jgi:hypothetical protein